MERGGEGVIFTQFLRPVMSIKIQGLALSLEFKAVALSLCPTSRGLAS